MDSINEVMEAVKAYCKEKTSDATYAFYIKDIKAVSFENSKTVTLELRSDFVMGIVSDRYTALLQDAFKAILGFDVEIRYVVAPPEDGVKPGDSENQMDEKSLPSGRYEFTFENFIKGPSNQFAFAAAQAVAANPSGAYNPLFIYGPSGLGKTHLLNAIKIEIQKNHPDFNIVYVDCEKFTNETITAIKTATMEQFRQRYRKADVLLIDDIQFLAGKESTQEEFFHTFNTLHNDGRQIVIASDRPAKEIKSLEERQRGDIYARVKVLTARLAPMSEFGRDILTRPPEVMERGKIYEYRHQPGDLVLALAEIQNRAERKMPPPKAAFAQIVQREPYPVESKARDILRHLKQGGMLRFLQLFRGSRSRSEVVATFLAVLELCRARILHLAGSETDCTVRQERELPQDLKL